MLKNSLETEGGCLFQRAAGKYRLNWIWEEKQQKNELVRQTRRRRCKRFTGRSWSQIWAGAHKFNRKQRTQAGCVSFPRIKYVHRQAGQCSLVISSIFFHFFPPANDWMATKLNMCRQYWSMKKLSWSVRAAAEKHISKHVYFFTGGVWIPPRLLELGQIWMYLGLFCSNVNGGTFHLSWLAEMRHRWNTRMIWITWWSGSAAVWLGRGQTPYKSQERQPTKSSGEERSECFMLGLLLLEKKLKFPQLHFQSENFTNSTCQ